MSSEATRAVFPGEDRTRLCANGQHYKYCRLTATHCSFVFHSKKGSDKNRSTSSQRHSHSRFVSYQEGHVDRQGHIRVNLPCSRQNASKTGWTPGQQTTRIISAPQSDVAQHMERSAQCRVRETRESWTALARRQAFSALFASLTCTLRLFRKAILSALLCFSRD